MESLLKYLKHTKMWGSPHSSEPEQSYEGELWVGGHPEWVEANDMGPNDRGPEANETKGRAAGIKQYQPQ